MSQKRGETVRRFILENTTGHPNDIAAFTGRHFGISRPAVLKHVRKLVDKGLLQFEGTNRNRKYSLCPLIDQAWDYLPENVEGEDWLWHQDIAPLLTRTSPNILDILQHCFTEMFNNIIDHSGGNAAHVHLTVNAINTEIMLSDNGEGIFVKIQKELGLLDERHAVLELSKGKLTTDPSRHTGEGIFFSSRLVDHFAILSGGIYFSHEHQSDIDWIAERKKFENGTCVFMKIRNDSQRTSKEVFDQYSPEENDYAFTKTVVPVRLAQYGDELLVSRSQAKRLLVRVDRFKTVLFDFTDVKSIGQAFADEVFRVFQNNHPEIELVPICTNKDVEQMIKRAVAASSSPGTN